MITRAEISQLPVDQMITIMEQLWEELSNKAQDVPVPQWQKDLLDERERKIASGEAKFIDWEDAKRQIDARCK